MKNYYEFYGLPVSPKVDEAELKRLFYTKSREYHPDFFTMASEAEQAHALEMSTFNNQAYQTLAHPDQRLKYLLELKDALAEEGKNQLPQDFLMEMMDLNEALMELEMEADPLKREQIIGMVDTIEAEMDRAVEPVVARYQNETVSEADLNVLKDHYLKKRYLLRIRENLDSFASL